MEAKRHVLLVLTLGSIALAGCSGSSSGTGAGPMQLVRVSNGFGELLPHKTFRLGSDGEPTGEVLAIRSEADLLGNVTRGNPVHPIPFFSSSAILPGGTPGSHFLYAEFTRPIDIDSVLSSLPGAQAENFLTGTITVVALNTETGEATPVRGRVFVNGQTYAGTPTGEPLRLSLQTWVTLENGVPTPVEVDGQFPGLGFPGTEGEFVGMQDLISPNTLVFVVDADDDLSTHETFPTGRQVRMRITTGVRSETNQQLADSALASTTVGPDTMPPRILVSPPPNPVPQISPGAGDTGVDPLTDIRIEFTEPMQPWSIGDLPVTMFPGLSGAIELHFGPPAQRVQVPFSVMPASVFDLTTYDLRPSFNFPGEGPADAECGIFNRVDVSVHSGALADLSENILGQSTTTFFETGPGPGIVNAPVAPDTVYVVRGGAQPGLSVIDLNGFGGGTGNPTFDVTNPVVEGNTNFPNNPNVFFQGALLQPPISAGQCTLNGGSAGVFTLTKDSSLDDKVVRAPIMLAPGDVMLGWSLDRVFDNGPAPFGCQAGGGNLCAADGFKQISVVVDGSTLSPGATNQTGTTVLIDNAPNIISWGPSPNPPPLVFPPLCVAPFIGGQEPTSIDSVLVLGLTNLLVPGDPFGNPQQGIPPSGLLTAQANNPFEGPSLPATSVNACTPFSLRQQVGHFMYLADRARREIIVLNSNRMTVIDRIQVPDPTSLAIGTNLDLLAVTNQTVDTVTFIDIRPSSATFHKIVKTTAVGRSPRGIAWEPGNEDVLVCCEGDNVLSILSAFSLEVRRTVGANLDRPFEVAITPRQATFGYLRNVYFAWILGRNGKVALFESGPAGINGWGYDDIIGVSAEAFLNPKTLQPDHVDARSGVWIVHEGPLDISTGALTGAPTDGAISKMAIVSGTTGIIPLGANLNLLVNPQIRDMAIGLDASVGQTQLRGVPIDIAFDNLLNVGGSPNWATSFSAGAPVVVNGKSIMRQLGAATTTNAPRFLFAAVPSPVSGPGGIDVLLLDGPLVRYDTNAFQPGIQSIPAPGVIGLMDYFRQ